MTSPVSAGAAGMLLPVRQGNAFEETVERLLTVIKLGMVADGERFPPERELAAQLGISGLTLREALGELQRAGYVVARAAGPAARSSPAARPAPPRASFAASPARTATS